MRNVKIAYNTIPQEIRGAFSSLVWLISGDGGGVLRRKKKPLASNFVYPASYKLYIILKERRQSIWGEGESLSQMAMLA